MPILLEKNDIYIAIFLTCFVSLAGGMIIGSILEADDVFHRFKLATENDFPIRFNEKYYKCYEYIEFSKPGNFTIDYGIPGNP